MSTFSPPKTRTTRFARLGDDDSGDGALRVAGTSVPAGPASPFPAARTSRNDWTSQRLPSSSTCSSSLRRSLTGRPLPSRATRSRSTTWASARNAGAGAAAPGAGGAGGGGTSVTAGGAGATCVGAGRGASVEAVAAAGDGAEAARADPSTRNGSRASKVAPEISSFTRSISSCSPGGALASGMLTSRVASPRSTFMAVAGPLAHSRPSSVRATNAACARGSPAPVSRAAPSSSIQPCRMLVASNARRASGSSRRPEAFATRRSERIGVESRSSPSGGTTKSTVTEPRRSPL